MAQVETPKPSAVRTRPATTPAVTVQDSGEPMTGAQALIRSLELAGATDVFGLPGGAILPAYDPLLDSNQLRHILVRHEQGAGHAAQGYAHATGRPGVCIATSGPGATNLVTPIADANMDSIPMVAITGQVGASFIGTDAFQEADIVGITQPITKHNMLVTDAADIPRAVAEAFLGGGSSSTSPSRLSSRRPSSTGPRASTCLASTREPSPTPRRSLKLPACSPRVGDPCSTWAAA